MIGRHARHLLRERSTMGVVWCTFAPRAASWPNARHISHLTDLTYRADRWVRRMYTHLLAFMMCAARRLEEKCEAFLGCGSSAFSRSVCQSFMVVAHIAEPGRGVKHAGFICARLHAYILVRCMQPCSRLRLEGPMGTLIAGSFRSLADGAGHAVAPTQPRTLPEQGRPSKCEKVARGRAGAVTPLPRGPHGPTPRFGADSEALAIFQQPLDRDTVTPCQRARGASDTHVLGLVCLASLRQAFVADVPPWPSSHDNTAETLEAHCHRVGTHARE